jgi:hypothetical protein
MLLDICILVLQHGSVCVKGEIPIHLFLTLLPAGYQPATLSF